MSRMKRAILIVLTIAAFAASVPTAFADAPGPGDKHAKVPTGMATRTARQAKSGLATFVYLRRAALGLRSPNLSALVIASARSQGCRASCRRLESERRRPCARGTARTSAPPAASRAARPPSCRGPDAARPRAPASPGSPQLLRPRAPVVADRDDLRLHRRCAVAEACSCGLAGRPLSTPMPCVMVVSAASSRRRKMR